MTSRFPDETPVEVHFPRTPQEEKGDRANWPWLPGTVLEQVGPDEYRVCVEVRDLAVRADGSRATPKTRRTSSTTRAAIGTPARSVSGVVPGE